MEAKRTPMRSTEASKVAQSATEDSFHSRSANHENSSNMKVIKRIQKPNSDRQISGEQAQVVATELAKCYEEVDQIYDYIRGLAPLPLELRKIKSIDFEHLEKFDRLRRERHQYAKNQANPAVESSNFGKVRYDSTQSRGQTKPRESHNLLKRLLPLKVTGGTVGPLIKRVESFSLNQNSQTSTSTSANPATRSKQTIEPIKLPRAQSTSNLHKTRPFTSVGRQAQVPNRQNFRTPRAQLNVQSQDRSERNSNLLLWPNSRVESFKMADRHVMRPTSMVVQTLPNSIGPTTKSKRLDERLSPTIKMIDVGSQPDLPSISPTNELDRRLDLKQGGRTSTSDSTSGSSQDSSSSESNSSKQDEVGKQAHDSSSDKTETTNSNSTSSPTEVSSSTSTSSDEARSFADQQRGRKQISTTTSASSRANELEKSPSEFENDTGSFISSKESENSTSIDSDPNNCRGMKFHGSRSSSSGRPSSPHLKPEPSKARGQRAQASNSTRAELEDAKSEHIYEQIPAHKTVLRPEIRSQPRLQAQPFVYPMVFAPSIGLRSSQQVGSQAKVRLTRNGLMTAQSLSRLNAIPDSPHSLRMYPGHRQAIRQRARPKERNPAQNFMINAIPSRSTTMDGQRFHTDRADLGMRLGSQPRQMSMSNLHVVPFMTSTHHHYKPQLIDPSNRSLPRSSSTTRVNARPSRQTPVQVVSQTGGYQIANSLNRRQHPQQSFLMWPQQTVRSQVQHPTSQMSEYLGYKQTYGVDSSLSKRRNPRRLTAIGIEQISLPKVSSLKQRYLEPVELVEAPLIDDEEGALDYSQSRNPGGMKARPLDSISDLQSGVSSSGQQTTLDESSEEPAVELIEATRRPKSASSRQRKSSSDNFVSSSSFIKCYYGRESSETPDTPRADSSKSSSKGEVKKRTGGEKLLGLIGLSQPSGYSVRRQPGKSPSLSGSASLQVGGETARAEEQTKTSEMAEQTRSSGGRRTSKGATPIRLFEYPTVQVASLVASSQRQAKQNTRISGKESPISAASLRKRLANVLAMGATSSTGKTVEAEQQSDSNTNDSTSSYEAAIKNGQTERAKPSESELRSRSIKQTKDRPLNSAGLSIKVPKLSKQSHLLSRPLPKPPAQATADSQTLQRSIAINSYGKTAAIGRSKHELNGDQKHPAKARRSVGSDENSLKSAAKVGTAAKQSSSQSLSPLAIAIGGSGNHSSPTVTTCTSSGISSRLTVGTHLAGNSNSIGSSLSHRTHLTAKKNRQAKQSDLEARLKSSDGASESPFALMDDERSNQVEEANCGQDGEKRVRSRRSLLTESPIFGLGSGSNLRDFDEKFSCQTYGGNQLASSSDSLLESINLVGQTANEMDQKEKKQKQQAKQNHSNNNSTKARPIFGISKVECI